MGAFKRANRVQFKLKYKHLFEWPELVLRTLENAFFTVPRQNTRL